MGKKLIALNFKPIGKDPCMEFDPTGNEYYYTECNEDFCYKNKNDICSLDLTKEEVNNIGEEEDIYSYKNRVKYCRDIYESLIREGQKSPVYLNKSTCGHYTFTDGQHRVCIAAKKGLKLNVQLYIDKDLCSICSQENKILKHIKDVEVMVSRTKPKRNIVNKLFKRYPKSVFQDSLDNWKKQLDEFQNYKKREYKKF